MKTHLYIIAFLLCILSAQAQKPLLQWTFDEVGSDSILGNTIILWAGRFLIGCLCYWNYRFHKLMLLQTE